MPEYQVKFQMGLRNQGWSYSFYKAGNSAAALITDARAFATPLLACHSSSAVIDYISASRLPLAEQPAGELGGRDQRRSILFVAPAPIVEANLPDITNSACHVRLFSEDGHNRSLYLCGLKDEQVKRWAHGQPNLQPELRNALTPLYQAIAQHSYQLRTINPPEGDFAFKDVLSIEDEAGSGSVNSLFTTRVDHGLVAGHVVAFTFDQSDVTLLPYTGNHRVVAAPTTNTFVLNSQFLGGADLLTPHRMQVRRVGYTYHAITEGEFVDFTTRQRGKRYGPSGREKGRSYRQKVG